MKDFKVVHWFYCILAAFIVLCASVVSVHASAPKPSEAAPVSQNAAPENSLLQFSAGGHILGFKPDKVYFASFDHAIVEEFVGTKGVMPVGEAGTAGKENTSDMKGAPALGKVVYKNLWQGITLKYEAKNGGIAESTYLLEPAAEVKDIRLKYNVAVEIQKGGTLRFRHPSENGYFSLSAPKAWQEINGKRTYVEVAFADYGDNTIGFRLGEYDRQYPVVIDPTYSWHTFYGSAGGTDQGNGIAVDTSGNVYVVGPSNATWNGPANTAPINAFSGSGGAYNIVVLKLNASGAYQWHTFFGAGTTGSYNNGKGITTDTSGNVYVAGTAYATFNGPGPTSPVNAFSGTTDIVVLKLNSTGAYQWHTFYGGASGDTGNGITTDSSANVYVTGYSYGNWTGPGAGPVNAGTAGAYNLTVLKLNTSGAYQWHTFHGPASSGVGTYGNVIAVASGGNIYVTGFSNGTWTGPASQAPVHAFSAGTDNITILKLNASGAYQWHTFYSSGSGSAGDEGRGIALDSSENVYVTGRVRSGMTAEGTPLNAYNTGATNNMVVLKLNSAGTYQWHTFYGANTSTNEGNGLTIDSSANVYVTGFSSATFNGPASTAPLNAYSGGSEDTVVLKLNSAGAYQWHTFYGSSGSFMEGWGIARDTSGNTYVAGRGGGTWGTPLNAYSGGVDIMVLKLGIATTVTTTGGAAAMVQNGPAVTVDSGITVVNDLGNITGGKVSITSGFATGDTLACTGNGTITCSYNATTGILTFTGTDTPANWQAVFRTVTIATTSASTTARTVAFTIGSAIPYTNGHFYEYISTTGTWTAGKAAAAARTLFGLQGYLATITSSGENDFVQQKLGADAWIGASDEFSQINTAIGGAPTYADQAAAEGRWYWVTGPVGEIGTNFSNGNYSTTVVVTYANWNALEPNNSGTTEHYGEIYSIAPGTGKWNDLPNTFSLGYVVEYGGMAGDPVVTLTASKTVNNTASYTVTANQTGTTGGTATITSNTGGINCTWNGTAQGGTCTSGAINHGTSVTLTAALPADTTIAWGAGCNVTTATTCTISSLTANRTITATYTYSPPPAPEPTPAPAPTPQPEPTPAPQPVTIPSYDPQISYTGGGWQSRTMPGSYSGSLTEIENIGGVFSSVALSFEGTTISLRSMTGPRGGTAKVYIDGAYITTINLHSTSTAFDVEVFSRTLSSGAHTLRIIPEPLLPGRRINIDRFIITR